MTAAARWLRRATALRPIYRPRRTVSLAVYLTFVVALLAAPWLAWHVLFEQEWLGTVVRATGGLVTGTLIANWMSIVIFAPILFGWGRLGLADVGLIGARLPAGIAVTVGCWAAVNLVSAGAALLGGERLTQNPEWASYGDVAMGGVVIGQLLGNALVEEVGDRGFLLPQLFALVERRVGGRRRLALALALVGSQLIFALAHVPRELELGNGGAELVGSELQLLGFGIAYALLYLRTGNLFVVVGIHALSNQPATLCDSSVPARPLVWAFALAVAVLWPPERPTG